MLQMLRNIDHPAPASEQTYKFLCSIRKGKKEKQLKNKANYHRNVFFFFTFYHFENAEEEQPSLKDLIKEMNGSLKETTLSAYDHYHMKRKWEQFDSEDIVPGGFGLANLVDWLLLPIEN